MKALSLIIILLASSLLYAAEPPTNPTPTLASQPNTLAPVSSTVPEAITNWQRAAIFGVGFQVPPGMTRTLVRVVDFVQPYWISTNISLHFNLGTAATVAFPPTIGTNLLVAGHPARMATRVRTVSPSSPQPQLPFQSFTNMAEVRVPDGPNGRFLIMTFIYREPADLPLMRAIIDTVRY